MLREFCDKCGREIPKPTKRKNKDGDEVDTDERFEVIFNVGLKSGEMFNISKDILCANCIQGFTPQTEPPNQD